MFCVIIKSMIYNLASILAMCFSIFVHSIFNFDGDRTVQELQQEKKTKKKSNAGNVLFKLQINNGK